MITSSFKFHWMLINTLYIGKDGEVLMSISCQVQGVFFFLNLECMLKSRWHLCCIVTGDTTHSAVFIPHSTEETPCIFITLTCPMAS